MCAIAHQASRLKPKKILFQIDKVATGIYVTNPTPTYIVIFSPKKCVKIYFCSHIYVTTYTNIELHQK